ncbi:hypothetical protein LCGC14_0298480 [marine sediment metagenome]|uniref:DNA repair protein RecN n=1 Tax=marine sediment metagenome TaxID=412755 RepID=A0A0F9TQV2_9ZZZZ
MTVAAGVDVARFGRDMTAIVGVEDTKVFAMNEWNKTDLMTSVGKVRDRCDKWHVDILAIDDTGVGGAVADAIGRRLARLAGTVQVLAVTHAPQVAARAATHLLISKAAADAGEDRVATRVAPIGETGRREEIARMLAGETVTDEARAAAERLIGAGA